MNKLAHGFVLGFFGTACGLVWMLLQLPRLVKPGAALPAFTRVCMDVGPWVMLALAILGTVYCLWVWIRKADGRDSWVAFLATATAILVFVMLPAIVAIYLPLVDTLRRLATK